MPPTRVVFYADENGSSPPLAWILQQPAKVQNKLLARIELLEQLGHELRRPVADYLDDGVHELRVRHQQVNYRLLYFFHEQTAVIAHGITKEQEVPRIEIARAVERAGRFKAAPAKHTYTE